jgi:curli biogenesis system outer membrane secretion channel CsgG
MTIIAIQALIFAFLAGCITAAAIEKEDGAVAVWDLENLNPADPVAADMSELLSNVVIDTLKTSGNYAIVERERLLLALEELNLSTTSVVAEETRLKIGMIVGARFMVFGTYFLFQDQMRLDLRMVEVESGSILKASSKSATGADPTDWMRAAREAALELL